MAESTLCGRVGCGEPAAGVLLMAAQEREAWLVGLDHDFAPDGVSLCAAHADRITVPLGWSLDDERPPAKPRRQRKRKAQKTTTSAGATPESAGTEATAEQASTEPPVESAPDVDATSPESSDDNAAPHKASSDKAAASKVADERAKADQPESLRATEVDTASTNEAAADEAPADAAEGVVEPADAGHGDEPTVQLPAVRLDHPSSPAEVPVNADATAVALDDDGPRLSVVPGEDDPNKTFDFEDDGQGALWAPSAEDAHEPDDRTPLLKRAFRVVRDD